MTAPDGPLDGILDGNRYVNRYFRAGAIGVVSGNAAGDIAVSGIAVRAVEAFAYTLGVDITEEITANINVNIAEV